MVSINSLLIDTSFTQIDVNVNTAIGETITQVLLWDVTTFKDYALAIDLSSKLAGVDESETFIITAADLGLTQILGIFYIEFTSSEVIVPGDGNSNINLGVVANLIHYQECVLDKILSLTINGCNDITDNSSCSDCENNACLVNTLLDTLKTSIQHGFYEEANKIKVALDGQCFTCNTCPDYADTSLVAGSGFGTVDNSIIVV